MIGVDIVDLSCSFDQSKHSLEDYKNRIINQVEYLFCETMLDLHCIWAIKESAYKCQYKKTGKSFISPKKILITHFSRQTGLFQVKIDSALYAGRFEIQDEYVFAICGTGHDVFTVNKLFIRKNHSSVAKEIELAHFFKGPYLYASFQMHSDGFPLGIVIDEEYFYYSRSHHGAYYISIITPPVYH